MRELNLSQPSSIIFVYLGMRTWVCIAAIAIILGDRLNVPFQRDWWCSWSIIRVSGSLQPSMVVDLLLLNLLALELDLLNEGGWSEVSLLTKQRGAPVWHPLRIDAFILVNRVVHASWPVALESLSRRMDVSTLLVFSVVRVRPAPTVGDFMLVMVRPVVSPCISLIIVLLIMHSDSGDRADWHQLIIWVITVRSASFLLRGVRISESSVIAEVFEFWLEIDVRLLKIWDALMLSLVELDTEVKVSQLFLSLLVDLGILMVYLILQTSLGSCCSVCTHRSEADSSFAIWILINKYLPFARICAFVNSKVLFDKRLLSYVMIQL